MQKAFNLINKIVHLSTYEIPTVFSLAIILLALLHEKTNISPALLGYV